MVASVWRACYWGRLSVGSRAAGVLAPELTTRPVRLVSRKAPSVPWPHAVDLDLEREAQDHSDQHDGPEDDDALDGLVDHDRADDVGDDEHFEAEQDHAAEVLAQVTEGVLTARRDDLADVASERAESPDDQDRRPDSFDDVDGVGEELAIGHGGLSSTRLRDPASLSGVGLFVGEVAGECEGDEGEEGSAEESGFE